LADHFLVQNCQNLGRSSLNLSTVAKQKLLAHQWPGNVRELRNVMERAAILEQTDEVQPDSLPDFELETQLRSSSSSSGGAEMDFELGFAEAVALFERKMIQKALEQNQFNINRSAEQLKMTRYSLRYRMQQLGLGNNSKDSDGPDE
jgi:DNA-binding NtrC family response regulator